MKIRVQEYIREDGSNPYKSWFEELDPRAAAKVAIATLRIEMGYTSNVKWFGGIDEPRIEWGPGYRVYMGKDGETLVMLLGEGTKRRQKAELTRQASSMPNTKHARPLEKTSRDQSIEGRRGDRNGIDERFQAGRG